MLWLYCEVVQLYNTSRVPVEGKSSVFLSCMKYRIIILILIIISMGQILLSYIANTSRTQASHACAHTCVHTLTRVHTHRRRIGYRYSLAPNRVGPLRWRQCRSLAIEINTRAGDPISPRFWMFFAYKKIATPNWVAISWQDVLSDETETIEQELRPAVCEHRQTDWRRIIV